MERERIASGSECGLQSGQCDGNGEFDADIDGSGGDVGGYVSGDDHWERWDAEPYGECEPDGGGAGLYSGSDAAQPECDGGEQRAVHGECGGGERI